MLTFALFRRLILMIYQCKHTNLPMSLLETKIKQGGWHEYKYYFDMGFDNSILLPNIHGPRSRNFSQSHNRMDSLHRKTMNNLDCQAKRV